jgi:hypothetical protein
MAAPGSRPLKTVDFFRKAGLLEHDGKHVSYKLRSGQIVHDIVLSSQNMDEYQGATARLARRLVCTINDASMPAWAKLDDAKALFRALEILEGQQAKQCMEHIFAEETRLGTALPNATIEGGGLEVEVDLYMFNNSGTEDKVFEIKSSYHPAFHTKDERQTQLYMYAISKMHEARGNFPQVSGQLVYLDRHDGGPNIETIVLDERAIARIERDKKAIFRQYAEPAAARKVAASVEDV